MREQRKLSLMKTLPFHIPQPEKGPLTVPPSIVHCREYLLHWDNRTTLGFMLLHITGIMDKIAVTLLGLNVTY